MEKRHSEVLAEFEFECERLQHKVESAEELADERQRRLLELEEQQSIAIDNFRRSAETEKRQLERKLDELEIRVRESIANANARRYEQQIEGKDNYEQQIEFLNSVIVDMQKKNDELKSRVQVLEEIGLFFNLDISIDNILIIFALSFQSKDSIDSYFLSLISISFFLIDFPIILLGLGEFDTSFQSRVRVNGHIRGNPKLISNH